MVMSGLAVLSTAMFLGSSGAVRLFPAYASETIVTRSIVVVRFSKRSLAPWRGRRTPQDISTHISIP